MVLSYSAKPAISALAVAQKGFWGSALLLRQRIDRIGLGYITNHFKASVLTMQSELHKPKAIELIQ